MTERTPYDGKPYYCRLCGVGLGEFMACEDGDCELETRAAAEKRAKEHRAKSLGPIEAECPECGRVVPMNKDGRLKLHNRSAILAGTGSYRRPCPHGRAVQPA